MKHRILLVITLLVTTLSFAQQGINYKALIKDDLGNILSNQDIEVRFFILDSGGSLEYNEDHLTTTNNNGIVILTIGEGLPGQSQDFTTIDWGEDTYVLRVGIDQELDGSFVYFDDTAFNVVPYALLADNVKNQTFKSGDGITFAENINDDFVYGSTQLDNTGNSSGNSRLFFDKGKAAFRAGRALDNQWDDNYVGNRSVAFGLNTIASGTYSMAIGNRTRAESLASTAIGAYNVGGGNPSAWVGTDPLFEIGNGTATISTEIRNNALTVLKTGNVGIGFNSESPTQALDVSGKIKVSNDFTTPTPGTIRYNETANTFEGYIDDTGWITLGGEKREKTIVIPATEFVATSSLYNSTAKVIFTSNLVRGSSIVILAPVILPVNSRIIEITYVFLDNSNDSDLFFSLTKSCGYSNETAEIISGSFHGLLNLNSSNFYNYSYSVDEIIQSSCQYNIYVQREGSDIFDMGVSKIFITYIED